MSDAKNKGRDTLENAFYDPSVLDHARKRLVALIGRRESPIVVTGDPGTGKSLLIRRVIKSLPAHDIPILLAYPRLSFQDVLDIVLKSLHIDNTTSAVNAEQDSSLDFVRWCLRKETVQGRYVTLFIDEAHDLDVELLTGLCQLVQKPVHGNAFLGLVLVGLPYLETKLAQPVLRDLVSATVSYFRLQPLSSKETASFVRHYFLAMGIQSDRAIPPDVMTQIGQYSRGILSLTNRLCDTLRILMKKKRTNEINASIVKEAAALCSIPLGPPKGSINSADSGGRLTRQPPAVIKPTAHADESERDRRAEQEPAPAQQQAEKEKKPQKLSSPRETPEGDRHDKQEPAPSQQQAKKEKKPQKLSSPRERPMDRTEKLNNILKNLQHGSPDVEACALITEDGLMIASSLPQDLDEITVGGMSATLLNLGTRATAELHRGDVQEVIVRGEQGYGVMVSADRGVLLLVVANERAKLGLIFFDMRAAINNIKRIL